MYKTQREKDLIARGYKDDATEFYCKKNAQERVAYYKTLGLKATVVQKTPRHCCTYYLVYKKKDQSLAELEEIVHQFDLLAKGIGPNGKVDGKSIKDLLNGLKFFA